VFFQPSSGTPHAPLRARKAGTFTRLIRLVNDSGIFTTSDSESIRWKIIGKAESGNLFGALRILPGN
jgi:hypothetical protein